MALLRRWLEDSRSELSQKVNQVLKVKSPRKSTRFWKSTRPKSQPGSESQLGVSVFAKEVLMVRG